MIAGTQPYDNLVETNLPWVPEAPAHWQLTPNKAYLKVRKVLVGSRHSQFRLLSLTKQGVIVRDVSNGKGKFSTDMGTSQEVRPGDIVFCLFDVPETPRTVGLSKHHGMITGAYTVMECQDPQVGQFLELFYKSMDDRKLLSPLYSGLRNTIPKGRLLGAKTPIPPSVEQAAIIKFVSHASAQIGAYIRAKRNLINLLEEQKRVIVHRAATRGLNPDVRMKATGLPWVSEAPAHWELKPNKAFLKIRKVLVGDRHHEYRLLSLTKKGVIVRDLSTGKGKFSADMGTSQEVRPGDIVFCLFDVPETPRTVGLSNHHGMITGAYTVMECDDLDIARFLEQFYIAMDDRKLLSPMYSGLRNTIPKNRLLGTKTPIPPHDERVAIVEHIRTATRCVQRSIRQARRAVQLLQEYQTRLMVDVVTGRLDVRAAAAHLPDRPTHEMLMDDRYEFDAQRFEEDDL